MIIALALLAVLSQDTSLSSADVVAITNRAVAEAIASPQPSANPRDLLFDLSGTKASFEAFAKRKFPIDSLAVLPDLPHTKRAANQVFICETPGVINPRCRVPLGKTFVRIIDVKAGDVAGSYKIVVNVRWTERYAGSATSMEGYRAFVTVTRAGQAWHAKVTSMAAGTTGKAELPHFRPSGG